MKAMFLSIPLLLLVSTSGLADVKKRHNNHHSNDHYQDYDMGSHSSMTTPDNFYLTDQQIGGIVNVSTNLVLEFSKIAMGKLFVSVMWEGKSNILENFC